MRAEIRPDRPQHQSSSLVELSSPWVGDDIGDIHAAQGCLATQRQFAQIKYVIVDSFCLEQQMSGIFGGHVSL
jgi:hypothetical protein